MGACIDIGFSCQNLPKMKLVDILLKVLQNYKDVLENNIFKYTSEAQLDSIL